MGFNDCHCYWCKALKWPLLYDLDGNHIWFEIPRSCSVTIKESFPDRKQVFRGTEEYEKLKDKKPVVIITDPIKRFISCINAYLAEHQRYYHYGKQIFQSYDNPINLDLCTKAEKIEFFFRNIDKINSNYQVHHFHPQTKFIDTENFNEFVILRRYQLSSYFGINSVLNFTRKEINEQDLSQHQINYLKNYYKSDYEFLEKYA